MLKELNKDDFNMGIVRDIGMAYSTPTSPRVTRHTMFECSDCGKQFVMQTKTAKNLGTSSCYHCSSVKKRLKHGYTGTRIYRIWEHMRIRCSSHKNYAGRGISVCESWNADCLPFIKWAMDNGYTDDLSIDRIDNDGNYTPDNCRWVAQNIQSRNSRKIRSTNTSGYRGVFYNSQKSKWQAKITVDYKVTHLGFYDEAHDAATAYDEYVLKNKLEHTINSEVHHG